MYLAQYSHYFEAVTAKANFLPNHHVPLPQALVLADISEKRAALTTSADVPSVQPWLVCL